MPSRGTPIAGRMVSGSCSDSPAGSVAGSEPQSPSGSASLLGSMRERLLMARGVLFSPTPPEAAPSPIAARAAGGAGGDVSGGGGGGGVWAEAKEPVGNEHIQWQVIEPKEDGGQAAASSRGTVPKTISEDIAGAGGGAASSTHAAPQPEGVLVEGEVSAAPGGEEEEEDQAGAAGRRPRLDRLVRLSRSLAVRGCIKLCWMVMEREGMRRALRTWALQTRFAAAKERMLRRSLAAEHPFDAWAHLVEQGKYDGELMVEGGSIFGPEGDVVSPVKQRRELGTPVKDKRELWADVSVEEFSIDLLEESRAMLASSVEELERELKAAKKTYEAESRGMREEIMRLRDALGRREDGGGHAAATEQSFFSPMARMSTMARSHSFVNRFFPSPSPIPPWSPFLLQRILDPDPRQ